MTAILYPVAISGAAALAAPMGRAARAREAQSLAGQEVAFVTEAVGPTYATREAALDAHVGRLEDDRPGQMVAVAPEDRYCRLTEVAQTRAPSPVKPVYREGRRWPDPAPPPATVWRVTVSYWRPASAAPQIEAPQARMARRRAPEAMGADLLRAMARQPLAPVKPQQPLDIGLFETRLPEAPHIVVPDE